jgi:hypothetical protein
MAPQFMAPTQPVQSYYTAQPDQAAPTYSAQPQYVTPAYPAQPPQFGAPACPAQAQSAMSGGKAAGVAPVAPRPEVSAADLPAAGSRGV